MDGADPQMRFLAAPHDNLRQGLPILKEEARLVHPVEAIQAQATVSSRQEGKRDTLQRLYGRAFVAQQDIERQILSRVQRLPGIPSARMGLGVVTGDFEDFGFEAYLGFPKEKVDTMPGDLHTQMEARLGMGAPPTRPLSF